MNLLTPRRTFANDLREMNRLMKRMFGSDGFDRLFEADFEGGLDLAAADWAPTVDIEEVADRYVIHAELPEVKREDVKLAVENGILTLTGERKKEKEDKGKRYHRIERSYGTFTRAFRLPKNVDDKAIDATFAEGVLAITLPKTTKAKPEVKEIEVH